MTPSSGDTVVDQAFIDEDWGGLDLAGVRFENCHLLRCAFAHADLREASFKNCGFADADGQQGVNFAFARLDEAAFENCNLAHARFEGADIYAARFKDCRLLGARFSRARFFRAFGRSVVRASVTFNDCNLDLADLAGVNLATCDLSDCRFQEADLSGADLEGANLTGGDLFHAILDGAKLAGADLRRAEISGLDLRRLGSSRDMKITVDQQFALLDAMGIDVNPA